MEQRRFGYIRVSTKDQNEMRQIRALEKYGVQKKDTFIDKQS